MAIINSYPTITPKSGDLVIITDTSTEGNPTKTATISSINALNYSPSIDLLQTEVTLTAAQMLSLNGGGSIEVLPAPGAGKLLALMNMMTQVDFNSVAYNFAAGGIIDKITFKIGGNEASGPSTLSFNVAADTFYITDPLSQVGVSASTPNSNLTLDATAGITVSQGDSPIKFSILYREITVS